MNRLKSTLSIFVFLMTFPAMAQQVEFSASFDREEISSDESVSLKLNVEIEGGNASITEPSFNSSDFDILNTFQSSYMDSYYRNGKFGMKNSKRITYVMRPKKTGNLSVTQIQIGVNGKVYKAPDLSVNVQESGGGQYAPPPRNAPRGQLGRNQQQPRSRGKSRGKGFFLKAEANKQDVFQGEQIVVAYYAYRRTRVSNHEITKFPTLEGFLREELDMPIIKRKMNSEKVIYNGQEYLRELLAKYAAYPLRTGELEIDPMRMKALYYSRGGRSSPFGDDPFFQFFNTLTPQVAVEQSRPIKINVKPLPAAGRLPSFSGGVGEFDVVATTDKPNGKAHEPIHFVVQVSGNGNVSNIQLPKLNLPNGVEIFDTSFETKRSRSGRSTKIFKTLLIPRVAGRIEIPAVSFQFFNPTTETYELKETAPIFVDVAPGAPGMGIASPATPSAKETQAQTTRDIRPLLPYSDSNSSFGASVRWISQIVFWIAALLFLTGLMFVILNRFELLDFVVAPKVAVKAMRAPKGAAEKADRLLSDLGGNGHLGKSYQKLSDLIIQELSERFKIGARSYSREVLKSKLVESGKMNPELWRDVSEILERAEMAQFAGGAGSSDQQNLFRSDIEKAKNVFRNFNA